MSVNVVVRPRARIDIVELAAYIGKDSVAAANRLMDACETTFDFLAKMPKMGANYPTKNPPLASLRAFRIKGFPNHVAFYLEREDGIEIVRVVHGARDIESIFEDE